jgi:hypothetical protein
MTHPASQYSSAPVWLYVGVVPPVDPRGWTQVSNCIQTGTPQSAKMEREEELVYQLEQQKLMSARDENRRKNLLVHSRIVFQAVLLIGGAILLATPLRWVGAAILTGQGAVGTYLWSAKSAAVA